MASVVSPNDRPLTFRLTKECFGRKRNELLAVYKNPGPITGGLVLVRFNRSVQVAKYIGPHIILDNGTLAWIYELLGVVL